ncbi:hypothetical protein CBR_g3876 [Chara braunii]|uniref:Uroporphyrinogen decarboxylase n=1 Tax=Chara braunii TaxID=69332 RepID=A0A388KGM5_CHABU|nr:hypothetical protein CBR_g3876 [Chara braunii]|eukprot:GBG69176.1 hypothetical protein CBR_g3876 [Chara braunii]
MAAGVCARLQQSARAQLLHVAAVQLAEAEAEAQVFVRNGAGSTGSAQPRSGRRGRGLRSSTAGKAACGGRAVLGFRGKENVRDGYGFLTCKNGFRGNDKMCTRGDQRRGTRGNELEEVIVRSSSMAANVQAVEAEEKEEGEEKSSSLADEGRREGQGQRQEEDPLLVRVARGEDAERAPVWLMRQAGRYMAEFRKFSDKLPFRQRSETADIAIELSLQPWRAFRPDGVIMFSDILTPLPALGIEFDVIKGKGPCIANPVRSLDSVRLLRPLDDPESSLPFIREILSTLRKEVASGRGGGGGGGGVDASPPAVLGFIGTPWTLAAYAMEGSADRNLVRTKGIMMREPAILHALLQHLADALIVYVNYQIESGAQVVQLFDSWAHHLSPSQFAQFSLPYAEQVMSAVKKVHPKVPLIFHANGGAGKLHLMRRSSADVLGLDWWMDMREARTELGPETVLQGNVDPMALFGREEVIRNAVAECLEAAGRRRHILNVGHGVIQGTPEESVKLFCDLARQSGRGKGVST